MRFAAVAIAWLTLVGSDSHTPAAGSLGNAAATSTPRAVERPALRIVTA